MKYVLCFLIVFNYFLFASRNHPDLEKQPSHDPFSSTSHEPFGDEDSHLVPLLRGVQTNAIQVPKKQTDKEILQNLIQKAFDEGDAGFNDANAYVGVDRWSLLPFMKAEIKRLCILYLPKDKDAFLTALPGQLSLGQRRSVVALAALPFAE